MQKLIAVILISSLCFAQVPVPNRPLGLTLGNTNSKLNLEAYVDLACPDCEQLQGVLDQVFKIVDLNKFSFTYHVFPLPLHFNAFFMNQGLVAIQDLYGNDAAYAYLQQNFKIRANFTEAITYLSSPHDNRVNYANQIAPALSQWNITSEIIQSLIDPNGSYNGDTRISWKIGASRSVAFTPAIFANGAAWGDEVENYSVDEWVSFITQYTN